VSAYYVCPPTKLARRIFFAAARAAAGRQRSSMRTHTYLFADSYIAPEKEPFRRSASGSWAERQRRRRRSSRYSALLIVCRHTAEEELQQILYTTINVSSYCGGAGAAAGATYSTMCVFAYHCICVLILQRRSCSRYYTLL
jgi:hypothetical protein